MEGWLAGCLTATAVIDGFLDFFIGLAEFRQTGSPLAVIGTIVISVAITLVMVCLLSAIPAAVVIWLSKRLQIGSVWFFGGTGAIAGGSSYFLLLSLLSRDPSRPPSTELSSLVPLFVVAGLAAGVAYWLVAVRHAGERRSAGPPPASEAIL
jgi:hypothetical protein